MPRATVMSRAEIALAVNRDPRRRRTFAPARSDAQRHRADDLNRRLESLERQHASLKRHHASLKRQHESLRRQHESKRRKLDLENESLRRDNRRMKRKIYELRSAASGEASTGTASLASPGTTPADVVTVQVNDTRGDMANCSEQSSGQRLRELVIEATSDGDLDRRCPACMDVCQLVETHGAPGVDEEMLRGLAFAVGKSTGSEVLLHRVKALRAIVDALPSAEAPSVLVRIQSILVDADVRHSGKTLQARIELQKLIHVVGVPAELVWKNRPKIEPQGYGRFHSKLAMGYAAPHLVDNVEYDMATLRLYPRGTVRDTAPFFDLIHNNPGWGVELDRLEPRGDSQPARSDYLESLLFKAKDGAGDQFELQDQRIYVEFGSGHCVVAVVGSELRDTCLRNPRPLKYNQKALRSLGYGWIACLIRVTDTRQALEPGEVVDSADERSSDVKQDLELVVASTRATVALEPRKHKARKPVKKSVKKPVKKAEKMRRRKAAFQKDDMVDTTGTLDAEGIDLANVVHGKRKPRPVRRLRLTHADTSQLSYVSTADPEVALGPRPPTRSARAFHLLVVDLEGSLQDRQLPRWTSVPAMVRALEFPRRLMEAVFGERVRVSSLPAATPVRSHDIGVSNDGETYVEASALAALGGERTVCVVRPDLYSDASPEYDWVYACVVAGEEPSEDFCVVAGEKSSEDFCVVSTHRIPGNSPGHPFLLAALCVSGACMALDVDLERHSAPCILKACCSVDALWDRRRAPLTPCPLCLRAMDREGLLVGGVAAAVERLRVLCTQTDVVKDLGVKDATLDVTLRALTGGL